MIWPALLQRKQPLRGPTCRVAGTAARQPVREPGWIQGGWRLRLIAGRPWDRGDPGQQTHTARYLSLIDLLARRRLGDSIGSNDESLVPLARAAGLQISADPSRPISHVRRPAPAFPRLPASVDHVHSHPAYMLARRKRQAAVHVVEDGVADPAAAGPGVERDVLSGGYLARESRLLVDQPPSLQARSREWVAASAQRREAARRCAYRLVGDLLEVGRAKSRPPRTLSAGHSRTHLRALNAGTRAASPSSAAPARNWSSVPNTRRPPPCTAGRAGRWSR